MYSESGVRLALGRLFPLLSSRSITLRPGHTLCYKMLECKYLCDKKALTNNIPNLNKQNVIKIISICLVVNYLSYSFEAASLFI